MKYLADAIADDFRRREQRAHEQGKELKGPPFEPIHDMDDHGQPVKGDDQ